MLALALAVGMPETSRRNRRPRRKAMPQAARNSTSIERVGNVTGLPRKAAASLAEFAGRVTVMGRVRGLRAPAGGRMIPYTSKVLPDRSSPTSSVAAALAAAAGRRQLVAPFARAIAGVVPSPLCAELPTLPMA